MARPLALDRLDRFYRELRRRKVMRVAAFYIVCAWVAIEVASVIFPGLLLPAWTVRLVILLALIAFPFVVALAWIFDLTPSGVQRTPDLALSGSTVAALPAPAARPKRSLAVLPFRNIGGDREDDYFAEGLAEDLLNVLVRVEGLRVAARSSAFAFRDTAADVRAIGEKLNVANVLEGSVRRSGERLRITVRLLDTADGFQRWTRVFDRERGDIFRIQDEISRAVFDALDIEVYGAKRPRIVPGTRDVRAYNLYLIGRHHFHRRTEESLRSAVRYFEQASERDPQFALAYSGLADSYSLLSASGESYGQIPVEEAIARAAPLIDRALELEPRLAEAHASLGYLNRLRQDPKAAERSLRRALELNPDYSTARSWLGITLTDLGQLREARAEFERAYEADPLSPIIGSNLAYALMKMGEADTAREFFARVVEIAPDFTVAYSGMAHLERRAGRPELAREWWERARRINSQRAYYAANLAMLYLEQEDLPAAEQALQEAEALVPNDTQIVRTRIAVLIAAGRDDELLSFTEGRLQGERSNVETLANAALAKLVCGQPEKALRYYERAGGDFQRWTSDALVWSWRFPHGLYYAETLSRTGARERAGALLDQADKLFERLQGEGLVNPELDYQRSLVLAMRGDFEAAAASLQHAVANGWRNRWQARRDPALAGLRERGLLNV